jgi:putative endonuclease
MNQYFVYILRCSDDSYYTGVTNDVEKRLFEHQEGHHQNSYTFNRRPVALVFHYKFNDINKAIEFEKQVKSWSRKKKEAIINDDWDKLKYLAACKNETSHKYFKRPSIDPTSGFDSAQPDNGPSDLS